MSDFLNALKADLLDRRLLPIVLVVVALVAAVGYAVLRREAPAPLRAASHLPHVRLSARCAGHRCHPEDP